MKKISLLLILMIILAGCGARFDERVISYANDFIDTPYAADPLGEDGGFDPDPLYRFDAFDCVTFVETVLALAASDSETEFIQNKKQISYFDGQVNYITRRHFFEIDHNWKDLTTNLGAPTKNISGTIDRAKMLSNKNQSLKSDAKPHDISLSYIDKNDVSKIDVSRLPRVSIFGIVMDDKTLHAKIGSDVLIAHTGFLIKEKNNLYIIHASSTAGRVVKQYFYKYIFNMNRIGVKIWGISNQ